MPKTKRLLALLASLTLLACGPQKGPHVPDQPNPSSSPTELPAPGETPPPVARVNVSIVIQGKQGQGIDGASVTLTSSSQAPQTATTNANGIVVFQALRQDTEYAVQVQAKGFENASRQAKLNQLVTQNQSDISLAIVLNSINTSLSGRVVDSQGNPLQGVTVFDTRQSKITDLNGQFQLVYSDPASTLRLSLSKVGYTSLNRTISIQIGQQQELGNLALTATTRPLVIGMDVSHQSFGLTGNAALQNYQGLMQTLQNKGYSVRVFDNEQNLTEQLQQLDALITLSPSSSYSVEFSSALQAFVLNGHKLIMTGEWAGFGGFSNAIANQIMAPFNLQFGADTLRENGSGYLNISALQAHPATTGVSALRIYQSASVRVNDPEKPGEIIARSEPTSFRIVNNTGAFGVVAVAPFGSGKAIIVGDSSLWSDQDSDGNQIANLEEAGNRLLLEQLLTW